MLNTPSQPKIGARWAGPVSVARLWTARLTLAGRLAGIHKEAWIPTTAIVVGGLRAFGFSLGALVVANLAAWLAWQWRQAGATAATPKTPCSPGSGTAGRSRSWPTPAPCPGWWPSPSSGPPGPGRAYRKLRAATRSAPTP